MAEITANMYFMSKAVEFINVTCAEFLEDISFVLESGSSNLIVTLRDDEDALFLRLLTGLSEPSGGNVLVLGEDINDASAAKANNIRRKTACIPINGGLVSNLKLWENITLPFLYETGKISHEIEDSTDDYLKQFGYNGNVMALPAHLSIYEKRMTAFIRAALRQPQLLVFANSFEGLPVALSSRFAEIASKFHDASPDRTTLYLAHSEKLPKNLPIDRIIRIH